MRLLFYYAQKGCESMSEKGINLRIKEFEGDISTAITKAQLPPTVLNYVLADYAEKMRKAGMVSVLAEQKAYEEGGKQDGKEVRKAELAASPVNSNTKKCG